LLTGAPVSIGIASVDENGLPLLLEETAGPTTGGPWFTSFAGACDGSGDIFLPPFATGVFECTVTNTYLNYGDPRDNALLRVIKVVDARSADPKDPLPAPSDFFMRIDPSGPDFPGGALESSAANGQLLTGQPVTIALNVNPNDPPSTS
jgi:hypothetical protein